MSLGERSDHTAIRYLQVAAVHLSVPNQSHREQDLARHHGKVIRARNRTDSRIGLCQLRGPRAPLRSSAVRVPICRSLTGHWETFLRDQSSSAWLATPDFELPTSNRSTRRRRPSTIAALRPAGPPPWQRHKYRSFPLSGNYSFSRPLDFIRQTAGIYSSFAQRRTCCARHHARPPAIGIEEYCPIASSERKHLPNVLSSECRCLNNESNGAAFQNGVIQCQYYFGS